MPIRVTLKNPAQRSFWLAQWIDPVTGKVKTRSTKTRVRREAERFAGRLEDELNAGTYREPVNVTWEEFKKRYLEEKAGSHADKTKLKAISTFNAIDAWRKPLHLRSVDVDFISQFQAHLRSKGLSEFTIKGHLSIIRRCLRWAKTMHMVAEVPQIAFPSLGDPRKGRAPTLEEFERILKAVEDHPEIVPPEFAASWKHYLRGMWWSGLRLEESTRLHWTNDEFMTPDFSGRYPMLRIQSAGEKGKTFRFLPVTPDFAAFLNETSPALRKGFVFSPLTWERGKRSGRHRPGANHISRVVRELGKAALVAVSSSKFASVHDFRRAFGERWAMKVMPKVLQELMRHDDIQTTMQFYVGKMAEDAAAAVWSAAQPSGNTFGNTQPGSKISRSQKKEKAPKN